MLGPERNTIILLIPRSGKSFCWEMKHPVSRSDPSNPVDVVNFVNLLILLRENLNM